MSSSRPPAISGLLLRRFTLRHWRIAPRATAVQILILALGVAVFFSVRLANRAALASFENFTALLTQPADWQIAAPAGALPESVLGEIRAALGNQPVDLLPIVETTGTTPPTRPDEPLGTREQFSLLGLDLVAVQNLAATREQNSGWFDQASVTNQFRGGNNLWNVLAATNEVFISPALAHRKHLQIGDPFPVVIDESIVPLKIAGLIPVSPAQLAPPENLLVFDLPELQRLAHRPGKLDRIDFVVPAGANVEARRRDLHAQLVTLGQQRWLVSSPTDRRNAASTMTQAFRLNLTILSLIGLLVGLYLIFQSLDGAVVRRREEIGVLRSLGVTETMIRRAWLLEAALLGACGGILGALLGWGGAQLAVRLVGRTVNALYFATTVQSARLSGGEFLAAVALAVGASLIAGWWPARQSAKIPPAQMLSRVAEQQERRTLLQSAPLGCLLLAFAAVLVWLPPWRFSGGLRFPLAGYLAALLLIFGGGILCAQTLRQVGRMFRLVGRHSIAAKLAAAHLAKSSSRHRLAAASLLCAVAMAAGMIILVGSFDTTMRAWIGYTFQADLYISSGGAQSASADSRISPVTWHAIVADPNIADAGVIQSAAIQLDGLSTMLVGVDFAFSQRHQNFIWRQPPRDEHVFAEAAGQNLGFVSESFADRFRVRRDDRITIPTPSGRQTITIVGVFSDYGNERGSLVIARQNFSRWFNDERVTSLILMTQSNVAPETVQQQLLAKFPGLSILTNRYLRSEILRIFHQTFAVTYALEFIGIVVAVIGLGMTLSSILLDRRTELTTLRTLGLNRGELARATAFEGGLLALCGVIAGTAASLGLGWILIYVINKQSFGWTLQFRVPWPALAALGALVVGAGTVVAYLVGRWGSHLAADREE
jgi:putative ABC transport system permease protein